MVEQRFEPPSDGGSDGKVFVYNAGDLVRSLGQGDPLEKEMATHCSSLAWKIPWTEEPGRLQSIGSQSQTQLNNFTFSSLSDSRAILHYYTL